MSDDTEDEVAHVEQDLGKDKQAQQKAFDRVTEGGEERDVAIDASKLENMQKMIASKKTNAVKSLREKELASVAVKEEDVDYLIKEFELTRPVVERALRENKGELKGALQYLISQ